MTVIGRLVALTVVIGGAGIVLIGTLVVGYLLRSSRTARRPESAAEPASSSPSTESTSTEATDSEQPSGSAGPFTQETESANEDTQSQADPPSPEEDPGPSTTVTNPQDIQTPPRTGTNQTAHRTTANTGSSRTRTTREASTRRTRRVYGSSSQRRNLSTEADNPYFKPVESDHSIRFADVDMRFSYLDVDYGPEFLELDPIPDLVEVDLGPSAISQELVRSPIEFKISYFLKALLAPTPRSTGADSPDETMRSEPDSTYARPRTDDIRTEQRQATQDTQDTRYREHRPSTHRPDRPRDSFQREEQSMRHRSEAPDHERRERRHFSADTPGYGSREDTDAAGIGRSDQPLFPDREPLTVDDPLDLPGPGAVDEPASDPVPDERRGGRPLFDVGAEYSPSRWDPPKLDADPFGRDDRGSAFPEPAEPSVDPVEPFSMFSDVEPGFGGETFGWEPDGSIEEPAAVPGIAEEMLGLKQFDEAPEEPVGLPGIDVEEGSNPLLPDSGVFSEGDVEENWLSF